MTQRPDPDLPQLPNIALGRYRHYKGGEYEVIALAHHSETHEPMVVYRALYGAHGLWVRPAHMWSEQVEHNGITQPRFMAAINPN